MRLHLVTNARGGLFLELHPLVDVRLRDPLIRVQSERRPKRLAEACRLDPAGPPPASTWRS